VKTTTIPLNLKIYAILWLSLVALSLSAGMNPEVSAQLPTHWGPDLQPDGYANKWFALLMLPIVSASVAALLKFIPIIDPRHQHLINSARAYHGTFWAVQALLGMLQLFLISYALGMGWSIATFLAPGMGILFTVMGNYLGKTQSSFTFGIRTPWTLSSETVWRKCHREAGYALLSLGLLLILSTPWANASTLLLGAMIGVGVALWVTVRSYFLWRVEQVDVDTSEEPQR